MTSRNFSFNGLCVTESCGATDIPAVAKLRENYVKKKLSAHYVNTVKNVWGVKNFCPSRLESEDEISIKLHMEKLEDQATRRPCNRDPHLIKLAMAERHKLITKENARPIAELRERGLVDN